MILSAKSITKFHNEKSILNNVSFTIGEQDKIALIGVNGTGKSTLLKIIAQIEEYEGDRIIKKGGTRISYLSQEAVFDQRLTIMEQVKKELNGVCEEFEIKSVLNKFGISDYNIAIKNLSGGQIKRIALAIALLQPCDLLMLDEPTNHLDNEMIEYLEKFLVKYNGAILMVTHDRYFLNAITSKIWEIDHSNIYEYMGNYTYFLDEKEKRKQNDLSIERKRDAFLKKELEWVRAGVQARGTKSKGRLDRFNELRGMKKVNDEQNVEMINVASRLGKKTIELENLSMAYGDHVLFENFEHHFKVNDRIGILGINGCGKSTLLKLISKELQPTRGNVIFGETIRLAYFKQGNDDMDDSLKVIDYIKEVSDDLNTMEGHFSAKQMLERFLFDSQLQYSKIARLSGGERRRLYLLKILMQAPNVLLLDEPTNDLDLATLMILEDYLDQFMGIIITVSHDRYFLDRICESLFVFQNGKIQKHIGGYSTFISINNENEKTSSVGAEAYAAHKQELKQNQAYLSSKDKRDLESMESVIEALQNDIAEIDQSMSINNPNFNEIDTLCKRRDMLLKQIDELSERWMYLLDIEEQIRNKK